MGKPETQTTEIVAKDIKDLKDLVLQMKHQMDDNQRVLQHQMDDNQYKLDNLARDLRQVKDASFDSGRSNVLINSRGLGLGSISDVPAFIDDEYNSVGDNRRVR